MNGTGTVQLPPGWEHNRLVITEKIVPLESDRPGIAGTRGYLLRADAGEMEFEITEPGGGGGSGRPAVEFELELLSQVGIFKRCVLDYCKLISIPRYFALTKFLNMRNVNAMKILNVFDDKNTRNNNWQCGYVQYH